VTDLDEFIGFLDRTGVVYRVEDDMSSELKIGVVISEGAGPKNIGYSGFLTAVGFDADGNLVSWGAWE
jgi:hypothetical protein